MRHTILSFTVSLFRQTRFSFSSCPPLSSLTTTPPNLPASLSSLPRAPLRHLATSARAHLLKMSAPDISTPAAAAASANALLTKTFSHPSFRPGQAAVIALLTCPPPSTPARVIAVLPTGGGKSLTYQVPALLYPKGITLVVSPLLALMRDQVQSLVAKGVSAAALDSTLSAQETRELYEAVANGDVRMLFVSPERFKNERFIRLIKKTTVALFVVDEAHCISEWGASFRPDYLRLARYADELNIERRLCLTATATPKVTEDIARAMGIPYPAGLVRTPSVRENLETRITLIESDFAGEGRNLSEVLEKRIEVLAARIKERDHGPTIVYVTLQKTAVVVADELRKLGLVDAKAYHAGMPADERKETQDWFMSVPDGQAGIVCATIAFGMGIDKANIRSVYHLNMPKSLEGYTQEIGRAGRDGLPSICEVLACVDDIPLLEGFVLGATPERSSIVAFVESLLEGKKVGDKVDLSTYDTSHELDIREGTLQQMLAQMDLHGGYIRETTPFYSELRCRIVDRPTYDDIIADSGSRASKILSLATGKGVLKTIDCRAVAEELKLQHGVISRTLDDLVRDDKLKKVTPYKLRSQFTVTRDPGDLSAIANTLYTVAKDMESREVGRLHEVIDHLSADSCQTKLLSARFGDDVSMIDSCNHCAVCFAGGRQAVTIEDKHVKRAGKTLDVRRWALVQAQADLPRDNAVLLARFAAGINSPVIGKKYKKLRGFGTMSDHSWETLLKAAKAHCGVGDGDVIEL